MRDTLPSSINATECGIVNLDSSKNSGTHWVAYWNGPRISIYFDSFGLPPPKEVASYLQPTRLQQTSQLQELSQVICGHLCVVVLQRMYRGDRFKNIVIDLENDIENDIVA
jgi:hypothetical protein